MNICTYKYIYTYTYELKGISLDLAITIAFHCYISGHNEFDPLKKALFILYLPLLSYRKAIYLDVYDSQCTIAFSLNYVDCYCEQRRWSSPWHKRVQKTIERAPRILLSSIKWAHLFLRWYALCTILQSYYCRRHINRASKPGQIFPAQGVNGQFYISEILRSYCWKYIKYIDINIYICNTNNVVIYYDL